MSASNPNDSAKIAQKFKFQEIGVGGVRRISGWVLEPQNRKLQGEQGRAVFRQMSEEDAVIGAMLFVLKMLLRSIEYPVVPPEDNPTPEEEAAAEFVQSCIDDLSDSWEDTLAPILSFLEYGWSFAETVYKIRRGPDEADPMYRSQFTDGKIGWRKIANRAQDTLHHWEMDDKGGVKGMWQYAAPTYQVTLIPIEKSLLFRTTTERNSPEGRSILLNAFRSWTYKRNFETIEGIGVERDLAGLPVVWADAAIFGDDADPSQKAMLAMLQKIVSNIRNDEQAGLVMPLLYDEAGHEMFKLELLSTGGARAFNTDAIVTRHNQNIAMVVLADFILLGHEAVGSKALAVSKVGVFTRAVQSWAEAIAGVFNRHAIPRLLKVNGMTVDRMPMMKPGEITEVDLAELGIFLQALAQSGMPLFPNEELQRDLLRKADLPDDPAPHAVAITAAAAAAAKPEPQPDANAETPGEPPADAQTTQPQPEPQPKPEPPDPDTVMVAGHSRRRPGLKAQGDG